MCRARRSVGGAATVPELVAEARLGVSRRSTKHSFGGCWGMWRADGAVWVAGCAGGRDGDCGSADRTGSRIGAAAARASAKAGVSAASVCHVAWGQVLARVSGREDVVLDGVVWTDAGRSGSGPGDGAVH